MPEVVLDLIRKLLDKRVHRLDERVVGLHLTPDVETEGTLLALLQRPHALWSRSHRVPTVMHLEGLQRAEEVAELRVQVLGDE